MRCQSIGKTKNRSSYYNFLFFIQGFRPNNTRRLYAILCDVQRLIAHVIYDIEIREWTVVNSEEVRLICFENLHFY